MLNVSGESPVSPPISLVLSPLQILAKTSKGEQGLSYFETVVLSMAFSPGPRIWRKCIMHTRMLQERL